MAKQAPKATKILTLKVTLDDSDPPIWRRFQVEDNRTLLHLHSVLQSVMGWENCHLFSFESHGKTYMPPSMDNYPSDEIDPATVELRDIFKRKGSKIIYVYDFGDDWIHTVVQEARGAAEPGVSYPRCLDGAMRCPLEDSGGLWGYYEKLEILADPKDPEYEDLLEWTGDDFDPEAFDLNAINEDLKTVYLRGEEEVEVGEYDEDDEDVTGTALLFGYAPPVSKLLALGDRPEEVDYAALGIGLEHVQELIGLAVDCRLIYSNEAASAPTWGPEHAWRALGQLRAEGALLPLVGFLALMENSDFGWLAEVAPSALAAIGPAAMPVLTLLFHDHHRQGRVRLVASETLSRIARLYEEARGECLEVLCHPLRHPEAQDNAFNGFLIADLIDMRATEALPVIKRAFEAGLVDPRVAGDWKTVQAEMRLP